MTRLAKVAADSQIASGELLAVDAEGLKIVLANVDGRIYACQLECPHQGTDLNLGELDGSTLTCISHGSEFDVVSGEVLGPPAEEGLIAYEVEVRDGDVYVAVPE